MRSGAVLPAALIAKWRADFEVIYIEVRDLAVQRAVYREVVTIATSNPSLAEVDERFFEWMAKTHANSAAVAVRKQVDRDRHAISLIRLLDAITPHAAMFTREEFVARAQVDTDSERDRIMLDELRHWHHARFDELASVGAQALSPDSVRADIARLQTTSERVTRFVNELVAHRDRRWFGALATWDDLNLAIDTLVDLVPKYNTLLEAGHARQMVPTYQGNWTAVFRIPWIPSKEPTTKIGAPQ